MISVIQQDATLLIRDMTAPLPSPSLQQHLPTPTCGVNISSPAGKYVQTGGIEKQIPSQSRAAGGKWRMEGDK